MRNMQLATSVRKLVDDTLKVQQPANGSSEEQLVSEIWDGRVYAMATPTVETARTVNERFGDSYLVWNVSDDGVVTEVYQLLRRQICDVQWLAPGKSRMPCLEAAVRMCYSIKGWLELDQKNVALVFCGNGKTRTGVLLACLLRFCGQVSTSLEGFREFCRRRCHVGGDVLNKLPPTIVQFFRWFDDVMHTKSYPNRFPLVLEKLRIQAVPVDDMPCIDVWDSRNVKVYSSTHSDPGSTTWEDEQGVYRDVKARLLGDFVVICRFGGKYAFDEEDETKVLFRYVGNTAFLVEGPIELDKKKLDMMKRYAAVFEEDSFLLELDFKLEESENRLVHAASTRGGNEVLEPALIGSGLPDHIYTDIEAAREGLFEISKMHHVTPDGALHAQLMGMGYSGAACALALQLGNNKIEKANLLLDKMAHLFQGGEAILLFLGDGSPYTLPTGRPDSGKKAGASDRNAVAAMASTWGGDAAIDDSGTSRDFNEGTGPNGRRQLEPVPIGSAPPANAAAVHASPNRASVFFGLRGHDAHHRTGDSLSLSRGASAAGSPAVLASPSSPNIGGALSSFFPKTLGGKSPERSGSIVKSSSSDGLADSRSEGSRRPVCTKCGESDPLRSSQVFQCAGCQRAYHTDCVGLKRIPFKQEEPSWLPYVRKTFATWRCEPCTTGEPPPSENPQGSASALETPGKSPARAMSNLNVSFHGVQRHVKSPALGLDRLGTVQASSRSPGASAAGNSTPSTPVRLASVVRSGGDAVERTPPRSQSSTALRELGSPDGTRTPAGMEGMGEVWQQEIVEMLEVMRREGIGSADELKQRLLQGTGGDSGSSSPAARRGVGAASPAVGAGRQPGDGGDAGTEKPPDPRAALTSMLSKRGAGDGKDADKPADPRAAMIAAISSRRSPCPAPAKAEADKPPADPRSATSAAITTRRSLSPSPIMSKPAEPADSKTAMFAAINSRRETDEAGVAPSNPTNPLGALLSDVKMRGTPPVGPGAGKPTDNRAALLAGIPNRGGGEEAKAMEEEKKVDSRAALNAHLLKQRRGPAAEQMEAKVATPALALNQMFAKRQAAESGADSEASEPLPPTSPPPTESEGGAEGAPQMVALKDHPKYKVYFMQLRIGAGGGVDAVKHKMIVDGLDPSVLDRSPDEKVPLPVAYKDHPKFAKYFRMLRMTGNVDQVKHMMRMDGVDDSLAEKSGDDLVEEEGPKVPAKDHPVYGEYYKKLKVGMAPLGVQQKIREAGLDPSFIDKFKPDDLAPVDYKPDKALAPPKAAVQVVPIKKVARKKLYWKEVPADRLKGDTFWNEDDALELDLNFDKQEFEKLFVQAGSPTNQSAKKVKTKVEKPPVVALLDGKRATNCAIAIARIKYEYEEIRERVQALDEQAFTLEQLNSLKESLPTDEEVKTLKAHTGEVARLGPAERFMLELLKLSDAGDRIEALKYMRQFHSRLSELRTDIKTVERACDDVKASQELKKLLKVVLTLGNTMNEGKQKAFTLDSLLKLAEAKAYDKKTSILHYLVQLLKKNDPSILDFRKGIQSVIPAAKKGFDLINAELKELEVGFAQVKKVSSTLQRPSSLVQCMSPPESAGGGATGGPLSATSPKAAAKPSMSAVIEPPSPRVHDVVIDKSEGGGPARRDHDADDVTTPSKQTSGGGLDICVDPSSQSDRPGEMTRSASCSTVRQRHLAIFLFMEKTEKSLEDIRVDKERMENKFLEVLRYFGEDPQMTPQQFFTTLESFMKLFEQAKDDIAREEKKKERERLMAERKLKQQNSGSGGTPGDGLRLRVGLVRAGSGPASSSSASSSKSSDASEGSREGEAGASGKTPPRRRAEGRSRGHNATQSIM